jgi:RNA polymerase sigma factor (sigma-70 family)
LGATDVAKRRGAFEALCHRYWKPVYRYVRIAWAKSNEESKDLAQAFFLWLLENDPLSTCDREGGSFRHYLKVVLRRFVGHQEAALHRLKRGGNRRALPLDGIPPEDLASDPRSVDPEKEFDRTWIAEIVREAVERVRVRLCAEGKERQFQVYERYEFHGARCTYEEVAAQSGLKATDVRNYLTAVRGAVHREIRLLLADTTLDEHDFEEEWRELFEG